MRFSYSRVIFALVLVFCSPAVAQTFTPPSPINFQDTTASKTTSGVKVKFTNTTGLPISGIAAVIGGANPASFGETDDCALAGGLALAPGSYCTITLSFTPAAPSKFTANLQLNYAGAAAPIVLALVGSGVKVSIKLAGVPPNSVSDTRYTVEAQASDESFADDISVTSDDKHMLLSQLSIFEKGKATFDVQFLTTGDHTLTVKDISVPALATDGTLRTTVTSTSDSALLECGSCYATLGAGAVLSTEKGGDYNNSSNILKSTHLGPSTPQFVVGIAYKLPFHPIFLGFFKNHSLYSKLNCNDESFYYPASEAQAAFCYPFKAFVSLKFAPDSSQTFNGFTYGISHAIHKKLDFMMGVSYSAHNQVSPGFRQAALDTVKTQQAANNPYYVKFDINALRDENSPTGFDGFPTQLLKADGTNGALIYGGDPLVVHYRAGFFIGVSLPLAFRTGASGK